MKIKCWNCCHEFEGSLSKDELGWYSYCEECKTSFDVDIEEYIVPNGIKVRFADGKIGIIDGNDNEDTDEFDDINYYVCPIEFTSMRYWSDYYVMLLRSEFEIIKE